MAETNAPDLRVVGERVGGPEDLVGEYLATLIGGTVKVKDIRVNWDEVLRLMASIKTGTVTASLILKKLANYPPQNGLAKALREIGKIERSLFGLDWYQDLRRRVNAGLNKGEARNALARAASSTAWASFGTAPTRTSRAAPAG